MALIQILNDNFAGVVILPAKAKSSQPRNLIICVDNGNMTKDFFTKIFRSYVPYLIKKIDRKMSYTNIYVVRSFPVVTNVAVAVGDLYSVFNGTGRAQDKNSPVGDLLEFGIDGAKIMYDEGFLVDILIVTQWKINSKKWIENLNYLAHECESVFYLYEMIVSGPDYQNDNLRCFQIDSKINFYDYIEDISEKFLSVVAYTPQLGKICFHGVNYVMMNQPKRIIYDSSEIMIDLREKTYVVVNYESLDFYIEGLDSGREKSFEDLVYFYNIITSCEPIYALEEKYHSVVKMAIAVKDLVCLERNFQLSDVVYFSRLVLAEAKNIYVKSAVKFIIDEKGEYSGSFNKALYEIANLTKVPDNRYSGKITDRIRRNIDLLCKRAVGEFSFDIGNDKLSQSREFFNSMITLSDWVDELTIGNATGLLINVSYDILCLVGVTGAKPKIHSVSMTFLSTKDYVDSVINSFRNAGVNDINKVNVISGEIVGTNNALIPMFICKEHWVIASVQLENMLGIALGNNPFAFADSHMNFMFYLLSDITRKTYLEQINDKWIKTYCALLRTCAEISYEKGYHKGLKKLLRNKDLGQRKRPFDNDVLFGQILSTGCSIRLNELIALCENIYMNLFKSTIGIYYDKNYLEYLLTVDNDIEQMTEFVSSKLSHEIEVILFNYQMCLIMKEVYRECGGFMKFLKLLDDNFGVCDNLLVGKIADRVKKYEGVKDAKLLYVMLGFDDYSKRMTRYVLEALVSKTKDLSLVAKAKTKFIGLF
ncbi:MAG: hypothetical protein Harvfovirus21_18 [Harvfovirus sp.]|uniref:Uncharacterized protein n=1 Tax=Harvfovirus sp. TaxID=2487768 RepID=A0A3G5A4S4_9VIRU|nr:MAG: hypothetical protein Harvfovirus21_18 [Harvfovirus sp.]